MKKNKNEFKPEIVPCLNSKCENCLWYLGNKECAAFDGKIPEKVWQGNHTQVLEEQSQPLVFEENGPIL